MNPFLAFFQGKDQNGGYLRNYRLVYDLSFLDPIGNGLALILNLIYAGFLLPVGAMATWLMSFVFEPGRVMEPASEWYEKLFGTFMDVVPPGLIASAAFGGLLVYVLWDRRANSRSLSEDFERLGVGLLLGSLVTLLASNPFRIMEWVLNLVPKAIQEIATGASTDTMVGNAVGTFMAPLTQMINFGRVLSGSCSAEWSAAMNSGGEASCAGVPESVSAGSVAVTLFGSVVVVLMLVFAGIIALAFLYHLTIAMWRWFTLMWVAAWSIARRRQFDGLAKAVQRAVSHTLMCVILSSFAMLGVAILGGIVGDMGTTSLVPAMLLYIIGYLFLIFAAMKLASSHGKLARAIRADTNGFLRQKMGTKAAAGGVGAGGEGADGMMDGRGRGAGRGRGRGLAQGADALSQMARGLNRGGGRPMGGDTGNKGFVTDHAGKRPYLSPAVTATTATRKGGKFRTLIAGGVGAAAGAAAMYFTGGNPAAGKAAAGAATKAAGAGFNAKDKRADDFAAGTAKAESKYQAAADRRAEARDQERQRTDEAAAASQREQAAPAGGTSQSEQAAPGAPAPRPQPQQTAAPSQAPAPVPLGALPQHGAPPVVGTGSAPAPSAAPTTAIPARPARSAAEVIREADAARAARDSGMDAQAAAVGSGSYRPREEMAQDAGRELPVPTRMGDHAPAPERPVAEHLTEGERTMAQARVEVGYQRLRTLCAAEGDPISVTPAEEDQERLLLSGMGAEPAGRGLFGSN